MRTYWKMKKDEWKIKRMLYGAIVRLMENQSEPADLARKLYTAFKDVPAEELQTKLISEIARLVHEQAAKEK